MPRKTKKQKIAAELRKKQTNFSAYQLTEDILHYSEKPIETEKKSPVPSYNYLVADLRKTFILTTLAIVFELVLYWVWR